VGISERLLKVTGRRCDGYAQAPYEEDTSIARTACGWHASTAAGRGNIEKFMLPSTSFCSSLQVWNSN